MKRVRGGADGVPIVDQRGPGDREARGDHPDANTKHDEGRNDQPEASCESGKRGVRGDAGSFHEPTAVAASSGLRITGYRLLAMQESRAPIDRSSDTKLSIVVPVYDEEESLEELVRRLLGVVEGLPGVEGELILVDDGSRDASFRSWSSWREAIGV